MTEDGDRLLRAELQGEAVTRRVDALNGQIVTLTLAVRAVDVKVDQVILNQSLAAGIAKALDNHNKHTFTLWQRVAAGVVATFAIVTPIVSLALSH